MADGRFLSKSIAHDLELSSVSMLADWLFLRCVPHLDKEGRMEGHPAVVRGKVCPMREAVTVADVGAGLAELQAAKLVRWYEVEGRQYLQFPGFDKNQKGLRKDREADSRHPSPQVQAAQEVEWVTPEDSGVGPEDARLSISEVEVKGSGSSLTNVRSEPGASADVENSDEPKLEDLWGAVPDLTGDKSTREYLDDIRKEHDEWWDRTAGVIRKQWWKGREIPNWTMGQEYTIWCQLVGHGFDAEELHGAISVAPKHLNFRGPATLKVFRSRDRGYPLINQCVGEWKKQQARNPQSIGSLLKKSMGDAA